MKFFSLHHVLLPVADVERAARFYESLGMERVPALGANKAWLQFGPHQLHLWPRDERHDYNGWNHEPSPHFALLGDDIHAFARAIPALGGTLLQEPGQRPDGGWYLFALDTEGNRFEVMQF